jgi:hypothetical protein
MLEAFNDYFDSISVTDPMRSRLEEVAGLAAALGVRAIDDVFLSQGQVMGQGMSVPAGVVVAPGPQMLSQPIQAAWFFVGDLAMEVAEFMGDVVRMDQVSLRGSITRWELRKQGSVTEGGANAWLSVGFNTWDNIGGGLLATGANCPRLWRILGERFVPNIRRAG